jgi:NAD(P)-dependent dehydrogenase (short-subunit alcohol dehydrogenase family)
VSATSAAELLRPGLLEGVSIMLAGPAGDPSAGDGSGPAVSRLGEALGDSTRTLSASLSECPLPADEEALAQRLRDGGAPDLLVVDGAAVFEGADPPGRDALSRALQLTWEVARTVAAALIEQQRPGKIVLVAPPGETGSPDTDTFAVACRAALENLARTTSIEWSRYGITIVSIALGPATPPETVAGLCAYLASPAGSYFSGCVLTLGS